ncbi:nucleotidyltransferase family protein [Candidatus Pacearchaeota archaeon]|nr:nucleotidyltransferase family protein [Candidatus Pacearchaeota archaeon]
MKAIILCAGKGERLRPITEAIPKPMIPINNKPVLEYLVLLCRKHNITEIAINTSYLPEKIKSYFGDGSKFGVKINYSFEQNLLGTSGALNNFRDFFKEPFFVIYGDNITDLNLTKMLKFHKEKKGKGTLYLYREKITDKKTGAGYVTINKNNQIEAIVEKPKEEELEKLNQIFSEKKFFNAGVYILEPEVLKIIPEGFSDFAKDIFPKVLMSDNLYGYKENCYFKEVGQFIRYQKAKEEVESGKIKFDFI